MRRLQPSEAGSVVRPHCHDGAAVAAGYAGCDKGAAMVGALNNECGRGEAGYYAVALYETATVGRGAGEVLGNETAIVGHLAGGVAVQTGVDAVEAVGQNGGGGEVALEGRTVGMYVYTIG